MKTKLIYLICLLTFLCSCTHSATPAGKESEKGNKFDFEATTQITEGNKNIYLVLKVLKGSQYWQDIVDGVTNAGKANNCNVYVGASELEGDWETQAELLTEAKERKADAILLAPANSTKLSAKLSEIRLSGTPVILVDTIMNDTSCFDTCYMTDNLTAGQYAAREMLRLLKQSGVADTESASVAIQITSVSSQTVIDRLTGFNQYWSANAPASWKVLDDIKLNNGDKEKAAQNCKDFLAEYPDLKGVFGCNNSSTVGFVNGLTDSDRKDICLVGFDYAAETASLIASDSYNASTIVQNQYNMGYHGLEQALTVIENDSASFKFVDTGTNVVTHENFKEYEKSLKR